MNTSENREVRRERRAEQVGTNALPTKSVRSWCFRVKKIASLTKNLSTPFEPRPKICDWRSSVTILRLPSDFFLRPHLLGLSSSCNSGVGDLSTGGVVGREISGRGERIVVALEVWFSSVGNASRDWLKTGLIVAALLVYDSRRACRWYGCECGGYAFAGCDGAPVAAFDDDVARWGLLFSLLKVEDEVEEVEPPTGFRLTRFLMRCISRFIFAAADSSSASDAVSVESGRGSLIDNLKAAPMGLLCLTAVAVAESGAT